MTDKSHAKPKTYEKHLASQVILKCKSGQLQIFFHLSHWPFRNRTLGVEEAAAEGPRACGIAPSQAVRQPAGQSGGCLVWCHNPTSESLSSGDVVVGTAVSRAAATGELSPLGRIRLGEAGKPTPIHPFTGILAKYRDPLLPDGSQPVDKKFLPIRS